MADVNLQIVTSLQDNASAALKKTGDSLSGVGKSLKDMGPAFSQMALAGGVAFGAITLAIKSSIDAANKATQIQAQLGAVLKSTGGIAGVTAEQAIKLSKALQNQSTYSDEAVLGAENLLLTFTKIKSDIFPDATKIVLDMSTALGQDLKSSAIQLGKALQDPVLGVTALRRVGVNFSEDQKKVIKSLVETGQSAQAQAMIMKELNTEFGGSASAAASTYAGKMEQLKNQVNDVQERIGNALIPILTKLLMAVVPLIEKIGDWIEKNPELTKWILLIALGVTGLITAIGILGLAAIAITGAFSAWAAIAGTVAIGIAGITSGLLLMAGPIGAAVIAVGALQNAFNNLKGTQEELISTNDRLADATTKGLAAAKSAYDAGRISAKQYQDQVKMMQQNQSDQNTVTQNSQPKSILDFILPHFASGGIVSSPTVGLIGEAGPEMVIPLSKMGGMGGGAVVVNINNGMFLDQNQARIFGNVLAKIINQNNKLTNI